MPRFSMRRVLAQENAMFRRSGRPILLIIRTDTIVDTAAYAPGNLFGPNTEPLEELTTYKKYIFGKFEEIDTETFGQSGRKKAVKGIITVPMLYKTLLAAADYIDPYLDGSRFRKTGAVVDEGRLYVTQMIEAFSLTNVAEIV